MLEERDYSGVVDHSGLAPWPDVPEEDRQIGRELKWLKDNGPQKLSSLVSSLSEEEADRLAHNEYIWSRDRQLVDFYSPYTVNLMMCGRGLV